MALLINFSFNCLSVILLYTYGWVTYIYTHSIWFRMTFCGKNADDWAYLVLNLEYSFKYLHCSHSSTCLINCPAAQERISSIENGWLLMNWCIFGGLSPLSSLPCEDKHSKAASNLFGIAPLTVWVASASVN